jgi:LmbE family N-acetylglucosaminyl deacetylase
LLKSLTGGATVHIAYLTDGSTQPEQRARIREEAAAVCRAMGVHALFLGLEVNHIPIEYEPSLEPLLAFMQEFQPEALFLPFLLDDHEDHRRVSHLILNLAGQLANTPREIWAYQIYSTVLPNVIVDITDVMGRKRALIRLWNSVPGERNWEHWVAGRDAFNSRFLSTRDERYVEDFFVVPWEDYLSLCRIYFSSPRHPGTVTSEK